MKAYFIAILTLFTCIATVVRAQQMSELENRIDSLLNGKKATVGIAVWTDKGDMLRYNDHVHFPCSVYSNSMWHWPYWTRWISKHQSGQHCFHKGIPNAAQYLQPPAEEVSTRISRLRLGTMQYSISKRQQCLRHLDRICRRHQTYQ